MMLRVYIAGPYRAESENELFLNILRARAEAAEWWSAGCAVFCPHANSAFMGGVADDSVFLAGDLEFLELCDVVVVLSGSQQSVGVQQEIARATELDLDIVYQQLPCGYTWRGDEYGDLRSLVSDLTDVVESKVSY